MSASKLVSTDSVSFMHPRGRESPHAATALLSLATVADTLLGISSAPSTSTCRSSNTDRMSFDQALVPNSFDTSVAFAMGAVVSTVRSSLGTTIGTFDMTHVIAGTSEQTKAEVYGSVPPVDARAIERSSELLLLQQQLQATTTGIVALCAPSGFGKTTLCRQFIDKVETLRNFPAGICWLTIGKVLHSIYST